jgi:hypothetical protein
MFLVRLSFELPYNASDVSVTLLFLKARNTGAKHTGSTSGCRSVSGHLTESCVLFK